MGLTELGTAVANKNMFRYRSYIYDEDLGMYYLHNRYYDPEVGRFINGDEVAYLGMDATILSFNLYVYCDNNPIAYIDPSGHRKTYVIYYDNPKGFTNEAWDCMYYNANSKNTIMKSVRKVKHFIAAWNNMDDKVDNVFIFVHGGTGILYFEDGNLSNNTTPSFSALKCKKVKRMLYLFSCHGGDGTVNNSVAYMFAKLGQCKVRATPYGVSFSKSGGFFGPYEARVPKEDFFKFSSGWGTYYYVDEKPKQRFSYRKWAI